MMSDVDASTVPNQPPNQTASKTHTKTRGFEIVTTTQRQHPSVQIRLPERSSQCSAGYDFYTPVGFVLSPEERFSVATDIKAYMQPDEYLALYPRSSLGIRGLMISNTVGIVDSDYYENPKNDGNIILFVQNIGQETLTIQAGDRIVQGVFSRYLQADADDNSVIRQGGFGESGR